MELSDVLRARAKPEAKEMMRSTVKGERKGIPILGMALRGAPSQEEEIYVLDLDSHFRKGLLKRMQRARV